MIHFVFLISRQGKCRLAKWFSNVPPKDRKKYVRDISTMCLARSQKLCNFIEFRDYKVIFKRQDATLSPSPHAY
jgi:AP-1 complex subunit sigma 1/2